MSGFSLYIHIPYCQAKCPYCDFNSYAAPCWPEGRYVAALCAEMRHAAQQVPWKDGAIGTIFFGGGTPSLFTPASIGCVLRTAASLWEIVPDVETTLEANPGTVSLEKLRGFRSAGINRVSFGVQSFWPHHLRTLGRIHDADEAKAVVGLARAGGFDNVSIDLIGALPDQTQEEWVSDLRQACALNPDHISAYNLTYEEGTPFHQWRAQGLLRQVPEETEVAMFTRAQEMLRAAGYVQYEISNYTRPGRECRHNLNYWCCGPYLGVGAGAHSYSGRSGDSLSSPLSQRGARGDLAAGMWGCRWNNEKSPDCYMQSVEMHGHARAASEALDERQARGEFVFLGLRRRDGFAATAFRARFGEELPNAFPHVTDLREKGLLHCADGRWQLTPRGLMVADSVFATFV